jgi:hypothetical protein
MIFIYIYIQHEIIKFYMENSAKQVILPNFASSLNNLHNFFNPFDLGNYFSITFL